jgi:hypothetical protein
MIPTFGLVVRMFALEMDFYCTTQMLGFMTTAPGRYLTLCSQVVNLIKYPLMPKQFKFFDFQLQNVLLLTF